MKKITLLLFLFISTVSLQANNNLSDLLSSKNLELHFNEALAFDKIPEATVDVVNGRITVNGAQLVAVYNITGQEVKNTDLSSGIYIVKITKGEKIAAVKVVIRS